MSSSTSSNSAVSGRWSKSFVSNDDITNLALYHTDARSRLSTTSQAGVRESTIGVYGQSEVEWTPWLRSMAMNGQ